MTIHHAGENDPRMNSYSNVWLVWSLVFLAAFAVLYAVSPFHRRVMLRAAIVTSAFGLTEPLFVPEYWNPPSLFDLAQRTGFDIESVIFAFAIGGLGVALYSRLAGRVPATISAQARNSSRHRLHAIALFTPAIVFVALTPLGLNPIYPAIIAMTAGAVAAVACRPDLLVKTLLGGFLFASFYAVFILGLAVTVPGYIESVWNLAALSGVLPAGVPLEELLFGFSFGLLWSSAYEHLTWTSNQPAHRSTPKALLVPTHSNDPGSRR